MSLVRTHGALRFPLTYSETMTISHSARQNDTCERPQSVEDIEEFFRAAAGPENELSPIQGNSVQAVMPNLINLLDLAALYDAKGSGLSRSQFRQTRAALGTLVVAPKVFQPRDMEDRSWTKDAHIANLAKVVRETGKLDPIEVFAIDGKLFVVDGHCRLRAYVQAGCNMSLKIPVRLVQGTLGDALKSCASANRKDKLAFTEDDKAEAAWRIVIYDEKRERYSLRAIEAATGISKSTVANMRKALTSEVDSDPREHSWREVKRKMRPEVKHDDDWKEKQKRAFAARLRKHFGDKPDVLPEVFLDAIEYTYPRLLALIFELVATEHRDAVLELAETMAEEEDDF